jgi:hypothetical protein
MNKANYVTLGLTIPLTLKEQVAEPKDLWKDLTAMFSELTSHPKWTQIKANHPLAYELLKVMP